MCSAWLENTLERFAGWEPVASVGESPFTIYIYYYVYYILYIISYVDIKTRQIFPLFLQVKHHSPTVRFQVSSQDLVYLVQVLATHRLQQLVFEVVAERQNHQLAVGEASLAVPECPIDVF